MKIEPMWDDDRFLWKAFVLSLLLHGALFHWRGLALPHREDQFIEVDITHIGSPGIPDGVPKAPSAGAHTPKSPPDSVSQHVTHAESEPEQKPAWESSIGPAAAPVGSHEYGLGDGNQNVLSQIPQLLNLSDLSAILKRFYPEDARATGREGTVVLDIHIDTDGHVTSSDIVKSAGADFDEAAKRVAALLRFTPAFMGSQRVTVKMRQAIEFKLKD